MFADYILHNTVRTGETNHNQHIKTGNGKCPTSAELSHGTVSLEDLIATLIRPTYLNHMVRSRFTLNVVGEAQEYILYAQTEKSYYRPSWR